VRGFAGRAEILGYEKGRNAGWNDPSRLRRHGLLEKGHTDGYESHSCDETAMLWACWSMVAHFTNVVMIMIVTTLIQT